jgi:5-methylcytosine-specific restriction endonuclease McrA
MTTTEDTQITELEIIRKYLFDRYDKLVVDVNNPSILQEDCDARDKRINIIDLIKKHSNLNDTGHLRELNYKYKKNLLFIEPDKEIFNPRFRRFEIVKGEQVFKYGKKTYYDNIIFPEYIKNIYYKKSNIYNKNFIDELLDAIYKEKIEEQEKHKRLEEEKEKKQKELQEQQNIQTQKELQKLKKQNTETQKELQKIKKQNTEIKDKKQKLQKQPIVKSKTDNNKKKKKPISATIKRLVWNTNIGEQIGKAKCMCCNVTDMTQMSFNCGHIIAESNGGETIVSNLKPICQNCNSSMGTKNMEEFIKTLK